MMEEMGQGVIDKVFRDPVHQNIEIESPVIYDLINTKEFQRLRRIKQLGAVPFVFHGAEHSRFSHCLGAYHLAKIITELFSKKFPESWDSNENLLTQTAALLHDIGHGAYSHTFERLFDTDHEAITREIITSKETEVNAILRRVAPDFPEKVADVISHKYPNQQVVQLISSQIDVDRMDYLLRDAFYSGTIYGLFEITRILRSIRPVKNSIAFKASGIRAVEDYVVCRHQMYMQVYFHPASRAVEVLLENLLKRAKFLFSQNNNEQRAYFQATSPRLLPFFEAKANLADYLRLDDGVLNTYFEEWMESSDKILQELATAYINRHLWKSVVYSPETEDLIPELKKLIETAGFDSEYYTGSHGIYDLPYDIYRPDSGHPRTNIEILEKNGQLTEITEFSTLIRSITGHSYGNLRFYFPKIMLENPEFCKFIENGK